MSLLIRSSLVVSFFLISLVNLASDTVPVTYYYKKHFIFNSGYWVYQDSSSNATDSITLETILHGYYSPNPAYPDYYEYYKIVYYSHTNDSTYNDFFWRNLWRVNGGGTWAELGQPVMWVDQWGHPSLGGFNGYKVLAILDTLQVGDIFYENVIWTHVYENQQYQHEFEFDTDLFYAEDIGLVREEYTDDNGIHHVWNLVNWEGNLITGTDEKEALSAQARIYPNPTKDKIAISFPGLNNVQVYNSQGKLLIEFRYPEIDLSSFPPGIYFLRLQAGNEVVVKKVVKL